MRKIGNKDVIFHHRTPNFRKITNSDKTSDNCGFFLKNFRYNISYVFCVVLFWKTPTKCVRNAGISVSFWQLCTGYSATGLSSHSVFQASIFFSMTVFKRKIINQFVLTWLKMLVIVFLRNIRYAVSILAVLQAGNFLYPATWVQI